MKAWWDELQSRERLAILGGGALLLALGLYLAVWQPFHARYQRLQQSVAEARALESWLGTAAVEARALRAARAPAPAVDDGQSLLAVVDSSTRAARLGPAVRRVEPEGSSTVRIWLEQAPFDQVLSWLVGLERERAVRPSSVALERTDQPGQVNARISLVEPSP